MKADNYKITQYSVGSILGYVENAQIAIPEIQRPFVWRGEEVKNLIDSLYEGYPIGYLIIWQNAQVRVKGFGKGGTKKILIDGQQRITALMAALLGKEVLDEQYRSKKIKIAFNPIAGPGEDHFAVCAAKYEADPKWVSDISLFFRPDFSFRQFEKEYKEANPGEDFSPLENAVDTLRSITKHQVGVIELSFLLDIDVVSEIFIRINLQGKPLNQEDFVMSKISVNEQYEGDSIRNCIDYFCHLLKEPSFFNVLSQNEPDFIRSGYGEAISWCDGTRENAYLPSYADVLKVVLIAYFGRTRIGDMVNLLSGRTGEKPEVSGEVAKEAFKKLGDGVKAFVSAKNFCGFQDALKKAGYCCGRLFYSQAVMNYCYAMYLIMDREGLSEEEKAALIGRWMTFVLITGHYQNGGEGIVFRDCIEIEEKGFAAYLKELEAEKLTDAFFAQELPEKFTATSARTAAFLAYIAMHCAKGTHSLYSDVTIRELYESRTETYQILPKAYLAKCGYTARGIYGQVANLTYITKEVRHIVKRRAPEAYRQRLSRAVGEDKIKASLLEHGISPAVFEADERNIEEILSERRRHMAEELREIFVGV